MEEGQGGTKGAT